VNPDESPASAYHNGAEALHVLVVRQGLFLMLAHKPVSSPVRWSLPSGRRTPDDELSTAVARIVRETTALDAELVGEVGLFNGCDSEGQWSQGTIAAATIADAQSISVSGVDGYLWWSLLEPPDGSPGVAEAVARYSDDPANKQQLLWALLRFSADMTTTQAALRRPADPGWDATARPEFDRRVPVLHAWLDHWGIPVSQPTFAADNSIPVDTTKSARGSTSPADRSEQRAEPTE